MEQNLVPSPQQPSLSPDQVLMQMRDKARRGEPLTKDEVRTSLAALRQRRLSAAEATPAKAKSKAVIRNADELVGLFGSK